MVFAFQRRKENMMIEIYFSGYSEKYVVNFYFPYTQKFYKQEVCANKEEVAELLG